jgi:hypothetical protein
LARLLREKYSQLTGAVPLSPNQRALWELERQVPGTPVNIVAFGLKLAVLFDKTIGEPVVRELVRRHPALRCCVKDLAGEPYQVFSDKGPRILREIDASGWSPEEWDRRVHEESHRPFDLENGPLIDLVLFRKSAQESMFLGRVHHLIVDLWSLLLLIEDLSAIFISQLKLESLVTQLTGQKPPEIRPGAPYTDFLAWQKRMLEGEQGRSQWEYWKNELDGVTEGVPLPLDRPRPPQADYQGATVPFQLDKESSRALTKLAKKEKTTLFVVLLSALEAYLAQFTDEGDVVVSTRMSARTRPEFSRTIGYFANFVLLRARIEPGWSFRDLIRHNKRKVQGALEHQDYPLPILQERLFSPSLPGAIPTDNVGMVFQQANRFRQYNEVVSNELEVPSHSLVGARLGGGLLEVSPVEIKMARHDLDWEVFEMEQGISGWMRYRTELFERGTVESLVRDLTEQTKARVREPDRPLAQGWSFVEGAQLGHQVDEPRQGGGDSYGDLLDATG